MKIFYDSDFKCHTANDGTMKSVELDFFDGKCDVFIEGYCYDDSKGCTRVYPWKNYNELASAQKEYETQQLIECKKALSELGVEL